MIFDHVSIEFGRWDCIGMSKSKDITIQYCIIGPGIGPQCFGCLCESDHVTFSHNLWISNKSRSPKSKGIVEYVNNVIYNWGVCGYVGGHSAADHSADVVNNYFIKGPNSNNHFPGEFKATIQFSKRATSSTRIGTASSMECRPSQRTSAQAKTRRHLPRPV